MDSITKLRGKLHEAEELLQYVSKELEEYSKDNGEQTQLNFAELKLRGEQYAFYEHPMKNQIFQDEYFTLLLSAISLGGKKEEGWTILYRVAAACDYQGNLQELITGAMTMTEERITEIIRMIYQAQLAKTFAIDSLLICHHMGADDAQIKYLAGLYELMKVDKNFLSEAMQFVKVIDSTLWENLATKSKAWKYLTANDIATYMGGYPATSLEEAAMLNYNRIIISGITYTNKDVLELDNWKASEILFLNCKFENCGGIYSSNKNLKFISCLFNGNIRRYDAFKRWTDVKYKKYRGFLHIIKVELLNCLFKNFWDCNVPMIYLNNGLINSCIFENCRRFGTTNMLLQVDNTEITKTKFLSCESSSLYTCMIYSSNCRLNENEFLNCTCKYYDDKYWGCLILLDNSSYCINCKFIDITFSVDFGYSNTHHSIIGLRKNSEENNNGDISTMNIKNLPEDFFNIDWKI